MERITMSIDESLAKEFDRIIQERGYTSRSEAMRDILRREVEARRAARDEKSACVASLSYVYNHHERDRNRLTLIHSRPLRGRRSVPGQNSIGRGGQDSAGANRLTTSPITTPHACRVSPRKA